MSYCLTGGAPTSMGRCPPTLKFGCWYLLYEYVMHVGLNVLDGVTGTGDSPALVHRLSIN